MIKVLRYIAVNPSITSFDTWDQIIALTGAESRNALPSLLRQIAGVGTSLVDRYGDGKSQKAVRSPVNAVLTFSKHPGLLLPSPNET